MKIRQTAYEINQILLLKLIPQPWALLIMSMPEFTPFCGNYGVLLQAVLTRAYVSGIWYDFLVSTVKLVSISRQMWVHRRAISTQTILQTPLIQLKTLSNPPFCWPCDMPNWRIYAILNQWDYFLSFLMHCTSSKSFLWSNLACRCLDVCVGTRWWTLEKRGEGDPRER